MIFPDYKETGLVYHVAPIIDLDEIINKGIKYDDKITYTTKYKAFHRYIDSFKKDFIPSWVIREKTIFASLNFNNGHTWHSHTVIMGLKINEDKCWIANENLANDIYEPFILKDIKSFEVAKDYLDKKGNKTIEKYWNTSLSFKENLKLRRDKTKGYDAEVLIQHDILKKDIKLIAIVSDHKIMSINEWKSFLSKGE
ncbi:MAG: hypothetical protein FH751_07840 [Firmicutes bacterium]|nr:hypothetical protein [Bacillota bacterium]